MFWSKIYDINQSYRFSSIIVRALYDILWLKGGREWQCGKGGGSGGSNSRLYCIPVDKAMLESEAELSFIKLKLKYL